MGFDVDVVDIVKTKISSIVSLPGAITGSVHTMRKTSRAPRKVCNNKYFVSPIGTVTQDTNEALWRQQYPARFYLGVSDCDTDDKFLGTLFVNWAITFTHPSTEDRRS